MSEEFLFLLLPPSFSISPSSLEISHKLKSAFSIDHLLMKEHESYKSNVRRHKHLLSQLEYRKLLMGLFSK